MAKVLKKSCAFTFIAASQKNLETYRVYRTALCQCKQIISFHKLARTVFYVLNERNVPQLFRAGSDQILLAKSFDLRVSVSQSIRMKGVEQAFLSRVLSANIYFLV